MRMSLPNGDRSSPLPLVFTHHRGPVQAAISIAMLVSGWSMALGVANATQPTNAIATTRITETNAANGTPRTLQPTAAPSTPGALYVQECGSCHVAYPTGALSASDWQRVMTQLDRHFGVNASLEDAQRATLAQWLSGSAGRGGAARQQPPGLPADALPRLTATAAFLREHHEVPAALWRSPQVGSASRCEACHVDAARGDFDEDRVRLPGRGQR